MKKLRIGLLTATLLAIAVITCADDAPPVKLKLRETPAKSTEGKQANFTDPTTGMEFVFVKGGCYQMGSNSSERIAEKPVHEVCLSDFYIGKYKVTRGQWRQIIGSVTSQRPFGSTECNSEDCPIMGSWDDAVKYIAKLNARSGKQYRLPTEAEWEYAARSGGKNDNYAGTNDYNMVGKYAWYKDNSGDMVHPVGLKKANGLGLYDMLGNFQEHCQDWYSDSYYDDSPKDNPRGPERGEYKVQRGGFYASPWIYLNTTIRFSGALDWSAFRLVLPAQ